ncbi:uncharacterized protein [Nicotiana tomentosiformis]|uniref:uncharacterized protein n=1 Tax=Nicotiana tomentosiformis TaxID=4098 RepID=UPI00388C34E5
MFLAAVARPRFDAQGNEIFSGKIGVFPFVTLERARRASANRAADTLETKPITSVTKDIVRSYLIEKVIPAIKAKWPREDLNYPIFIQQDNARAHIQLVDEEFCRVATQNGFDIRLTSQPPNSPDLNMLDLVFLELFSHYGIRSHLQLLMSYLLQLRSHLKSCMVEIMRAKGCHNYKIPHLSKAILERKGQLPSQLKCDASLVQEVLSYLDGSN